MATVRSVVEELRAKGKEKTRDLCTAWDAGGWADAGGEHGGYEAGREEAARGAGAGDGVVCDGDLRGSLSGGDAKIGDVSVDVGETACQVPVAAGSIAKMEKMGRVGKKRKTMRC
jgi:hypothetical protein